MKWILTSILLLIIGLVVFKNYLESDYYKEKLESDYQKRQNLTDERYAEVDRKYDSILNIKKTREVYESLVNEIYFMKNFKPSYPKNNMADILNDIGLYHTAWKKIKNAESFNVDSIRQKSDDLKTILEKSQVKYFPLMRKSYFEIKKEELWYDDVDLKLSGKGNTGLTFTGGIFAANSNKSKAMDAGRETFNAFRFKKITFFWYEYDDNGTSYTLSSPEDKDPVTEQY